MDDKEHQEELHAKTGWEEDSKRLKAKRRSLEEKAKTLEEKARAEKLAIDKKLVVEILEEENRTHNDAVRELEERIAELEQQLKSSPRTESTETQINSESVPEISVNANESVNVGVFPPSEQVEVELSAEGSKRKKRSLF